MDDSGNICRTTYLAFSMAKREGTIEAGRTTQVEYNAFFADNFNW